MKCVIEDRALSGNTYVVTAGGEVDLDAASTLQEHLERAMEAGAERLIVELLDGAFIDSVTIGLLLGARRSMHTRGGTMQLVCSDPRLLRIFEIVGLTERFRIDRGLIDALA